MEAHKFKETNFSICIVNMNTIVTVISYKNNDRKLTLITDSMNIVEIHWPIYKLLFYLLNSLPEKYKLIGSAF